MIAIFSSILASVGLGALNPFVPVFVSMDMIISTLCVILMYKWNSYITSKIFYCCMPPKISAMSVAISNDRPSSANNAPLETIDTDKPSIPTTDPSIKSVNSNSDPLHDSNTITMTTMASSQPSQMSSSEVP